MKLGHDENGDAVSRLASLFPLFFCFSIFEFPARRKKRWGRPTGPPIITSHIDELSKGSVSGPEILKNN